MTVKSMLVAVDFNDKVRPAALEIDDVWPKR
jgi:hypothetical protein